MKRITREPLVHFLAVGALLFGLNAWRTDKGSDAKSSALIAVTPGVIDRLRAGYERQFGKAPDADELRGLVTAHIREEVLYREALALGLDRNDRIVRQRLAQKMEFLSNDLVGGLEPTEAALHSYFATNAARYSRPARITFSHVYFSREKRGKGAEAGALEGLATLKQGASDDSLGDPFLHGFEFAEREPEDIAALFGPEFAERLSDLPSGGWQGPVASGYGLHLVKVQARSAEQPVELVAVRTAVLRDFNDERRRTANREVLEQLKERYTITVDEAAITRAAESSPPTAQAIP